MPVLIFQPGFLGATSWNGPNSVAILESSPNFSLPSTQDRQSWPVSRNIGLVSWFNTTTGKDIGLPISAKTVHGPNTCLYAGHLRPLPPRAMASRGFIGALSREQWADIATWSKSSSGPGRVLFKGFRLGRLFSEIRLLQGCSMAKDSRVGNISSTGCLRNTSTSFARPRSQRCGNGRRPRRGWKS